MKKLSVSTFKNEIVVNIRQFYASYNTGEELPGKTGIALRVEHWNIILKHVRTCDCHFNSLIIAWFEIISVG
jgi:sulfur relay (sulfurtransferase) DsrC/TusE family protein